MASHLARQLEFSYVAAMAHDHGHHEHHHDHSHGHDHSHAPQDFGPRFLIAAALNAVFIVAELIYGLASQSLALLADAGHNFSDVVGLLLAWVAWGLAKRKPGPNFTYGYRSASIIAALFNALLLFAAVAVIVWEAVRRLQTPAAVEGETVIWVAALGILINGVTAWLFVGGQKDLNIKAAFAHLAMDAVVSAVVVVSGVVLLYTGWAWVDPALSILVSGVIIWGTWGLLRESTGLALQGVPKHIDYAKVKAWLASQTGVGEVHDLHIWGMSTTEVALTVHLVMPDGHPGDAFLHELTHELEHDFGIGHVTIQIETGTHPCGLAPDDVI
ncbi:cation diffusion facilitator family transporter [Asticcacaulis biprosthecium]|nr:cation diffusion facilitator family transporter [Asticcacaulis biprosthecium]